MPQVIPPAGTDGTPSLVSDGLQRIDQGFGVWDAFYFALADYLNALLAFLGSEFAADIGEIGI